MKWLLVVDRVRVPSPHYSDTEHEPEGCEGCKSWYKFCIKYDMRPMADATWSRRAWIDSLSTYLRGADYLFLRDGELVDIGG